MKKCVRLLFASVLSLLTCCEDKKAEDTMKFVVCADYPPFEFYEDGKIVGFDIDLATEVAAKLGKKAIFQDMQQLGTMLFAIKNGDADAAISALSYTPERRENYDFSIGYYAESLAVVYRIDHPVTTTEQLEHEKVACQLGSTMEIWIQKNVPGAVLISIDNNNLAIESLKAGHVAAVVIDEVQASVFCKNNPGLAFVTVATTGEQYAIPLKKGSLLKKSIDTALEELKVSGKMGELKKKWLH